MGDERAVAAVVEEEHVPGAGRVDHFAQSPADVGSRRDHRGPRGIGEHHDVVGVEPEAADEGVSHRLDVVDAPAELVPRPLVVAPHKCG